MILGYTNWAEWSAVATGLSMLLSAIVLCTKAKDRFTSILGGVFIGGYGLWGLNRDSGTFFYSAYFLVVPVVLVAALAQKLLGTKK